ncbi:hypothetical protein KDA_55320 [Dictyobacter alpinus]|uniref:ACT domain-containing protein n=1 Tax=Dictyobacter alpinus TaxID=2014873 RepID=A0A402BF80_9CHLR|nr:hypothetical protein KDA_55320 [Dictyobacter alpinus]
MAQRTIAISISMPDEENDKISAFLDSLRGIGVIRISGFAKDGAVSMGTKEVS